GGYVDAWERSDVGALAAMLTEDVVLSMPPHSAWYQGRSAVVDFLARRPMAAGRRWPTVPTRANGQLAFAQYLVDPDDGPTGPHGVTVLTLRGARIEALTVFLMPELLERFGLPAQPARW